MTPEDIVREFHRLYLDRGLHAYYAVQPQDRGEGESSIATSAFPVTNNCSASVLTPARKSSIAVLLSRLDLRQFDKSLSLNLSQKDALEWLQPLKGEADLPASLGTSKMFGLREVR